MASHWIRPGAIVTEVANGQFAAPGVGYVTESASQPAVGTITLNQFAAYRVFEGAAGSAQITLSGSHTGPTDTIEYRIETDAGIPVTAWATLQADVVEGAFSATVTVPRGGWYFAHVRKAAATSTEAIHSQRWGVGVIVGGMGQSQIVFWQGATYAGTPNPRAVNFDGTNWAQMTTAGRYKNIFAEAVIAAMNCPVAIVVYGVNGTQIEQWYDSATGKKASYLIWEDMVTAAGGKLSSMIWWQGEGDVMAERSKAAYLTDLYALLATLRTEYGATLPVVMPQLGRITSGTTDAAVESIRDAQVEAARASARNYGITTIQFPLVDGVHFDDAGQIGISQRLAQCVAHALGFASYARSPVIGGAVRIDPTTIDVRIVHSGGTDITPATGITGFSVLDGVGSPVTISSAGRQAANIVRLTLASTPAGVPTVRYGFGANPTVSNILKDNTGLGLALETTDADVSAQGRRIVLDCVQRVGGAPTASKTGLNIAVFSGQRTDQLAAPEVSLTGKATNASGVLDESIVGTSANVGDYVTVVCSDSDGTPGADSFGFVALVPVSG